MEDIDKAFVKKVEKGDVIVAAGTSAAALPVSTHRSSKTCGTVASLQRALRVFSTATPSISACRFSSARKRQTRSTQTTKFRSIFDTGIITDITTGKTYKAQPFPAVHSEHHQSRRLAEVPQGGGKQMTKNIAVIRGDGIGRRS